MYDLIRQLFWNMLPIVLMIGLIPIFWEERLLVAAYAVVILVTFAIRFDRRDLIFFAFGYIALSISEYFFVLTGVETFTHRTFLGVMPLWLPFLWGYAFVVIRRSIMALEKYIRF